MGDDDDAVDPQKQGATESPDVDSSLSDLADRIRQRDEWVTEGPEASDLEDLADSVRQGNAPVSDPGGHVEDASEWDIVEGPEADQLPDSKVEAIIELVSGDPNILIDGPTDTPTEHNLCAALLSGGDPQPINLLLVTINHTPPERLKALEKYLSAPVEEVTVVNAETYRRSRVDSDHEGPVKVRTISDPTDLRRLGLQISSVLSGWDESDARTVLCFHSISDLIELVENNQIIFRFLHVLQGRVGAADAFAHYHIDSSRHEKEVMGTFDSLYGQMLEFDEGGSISVD